MAEAAMDEYEKRIREKVYDVLTLGEWVYLVGVFEAVREHEEMCVKHGRKARGNDLNRPQTT